MYGLLLLHHNYVLIHIIIDNFFVFFTPIYAYILSRIICGILNMHLTKWSMIMKKNTIIQTYSFHCVHKTFLQLLPHFRIYLVVKL